MPNAGGGVFGRRGNVEAEPPVPNNDDGGMAPPSEGADDESCSMPVAVEVLALGVLPHCVPSITAESSFATCGVRGRGPISQATNCDPRC